MAPRVAGLPDPKKNITLGAIMRVLPEAGETAHLQWEILKRQYIQTSKTKYIYFVTRRLVSQEPQKKQQQANIHPSDLTLLSTLVVVSWWQLLHWTWAGSWPNILSGSTTVMGMGTLVSIMSLLLLSGENNKVMSPQRRERKIY